MASPLESLIRNEIRKGFRGQLLTGTLRRVSPSTSLDEFGDPVSETPETFTFEGFPDNFSEFYRVRAGIPDSNVKIVIIAGSLSVTPQKDDQIKLRDKWYQVISAMVDPALAAWELKAFEIEDPTI